MATQRHLREGDQLADDDTVVVRGGDHLDAASLRADAQRYNSIYGGFGISVFAARNASMDELAQEAPLVRFRVLTLMRVGVLRTARFRCSQTTATTDAARELASQISYLPPSRKFAVRTDSDPVHGPSCAAGLAAPKQI